MGIADGTGFNTRVKQFTDALVATHLQGPDAYSKLAASAQGQDPLAWAVAVDTFKKLSASSANQQAMQQGQQGQQPPVLAQRAMQERGLAGMPTSQEMFDPRLHAQGIGAVEEPTGPVAHAAGGGIIAFNEGGNPPDPNDMVDPNERTRQERPRPFTEEEARQRARARVAADIEARRTAQMGSPRPAVGVPASLPSASVAERAVLGLEGVGKKAGAAGLGLLLGKALEPVAEATGIPEALSRGVEKLFPFNIGTGWSVPDQPKKAVAAPTAAPTAQEQFKRITDEEVGLVKAELERTDSNIAALGRELASSPPNPQVIQQELDEESKRRDKLIGRLQGVAPDVLAKIPAAGDANALGGTPTTRAGTEQPTRRIAPIKSTTGEPPARTIAKPDVENEGLQLAREARNDARRMVEEAQQAGPPKTMGQYVGDITGAIKEAGVTGEVGTEAESNIRANLAKVSDDKKFALGMAIAQAGFAAAAGKSQYALSNIAEGFGIGVKQYTSAMADIKKAQREEEKALADIQMARRGEKLRVGTTAYEQSRKDIDNATKRLDDARKTQAVVTSNLANAVMDKESADLRTGAMLDQNSLTRMNNTELKLQAEKMGLVKEIGDRVGEITKGTPIAPTPQQRIEIERQVAIEVMSRANQLGMKSAENYTAPAPAAPAGIPGAKVVGVR